MKKVLTVLLAVSLCLVVSGYVSAAEKSPASRAVSPAVGTPAVGAVATMAPCPTGFESKPIGTGKSSFHCVRKKPANPCPQGYHVKWTTCQSDCNDMLASGKAECQNCTFQCLPDLPAKPNYDCGPGYTLMTGFCEISCSMIPK